MKINHKKVRNYNQFLLALAGTIAILFIIGAGLLTAYETFRYYSKEEHTTGILSNDETDELQKDSLRKQIISFERLSIIDSAKQLYLLPVTQADLVDYERSGSLLSLPRTDHKLLRFKSHVYNNLVLCDLNNEFSKIIFDSKVSISHFTKHEIKEKKYIIIIASAKDSNHDQYLNSDDLQDLFIYNIEKSELTQIELEENFTTLSVFTPPKSNKLIGQIGLDRDNSGQFIKHKEPLLYYKIDVEKKQLISLVEMEQIETLQKLLDGRK